MFLVKKKTYVFGEKYVDFSSLYAMLTSRIPFRMLDY